MRRAELEHWSGKDVARLLSLVEPERRYYQKIVSGIPLGLAVIAEDLRILAANEAFRHRYSLDRREVLGRSIDHVLPAEGLREHLLEAIHTRQPHAGLPCRLELPAESLSLRISITPLRRTDDQLADDADEEFLIVVESAADSPAEATSARRPPTPRIPSFPFPSAPPAPTLEQQQQIETLQRRLRQAEQEVEQLRQLEREAARAHELEAELERLRDEAKAHAAEPPSPEPSPHAEALQQAEAELDRIRRQLRDAQAEVERLSSLAAELERLRPAVAAVERLRELEREVEELRQAKARLAAAEAELAELRPALHKLEKLREAEAELARLQTLQEELAALRAAHQDAVARWQAAEEEAERLREAQQSFERLQLTLRSVEKLRAAAQASAQRFADVVEMLDAIVWEAHAETFRTVFVSRRVESILGFSTEQLLQEAGFLVNRIHSDDRARVLAFYRSLREGEPPQRIEYRAARADGRTIWLREDVHAVRDPDTGALHLRGVSADITALKSLTLPAPSSDKLESLARLAARLSHDFNNFLTTISGYSEFILERMGGYAKFSPFLRDVEEIKKASERAASLTRQLLLFSQKQVLDPHFVDVNQILSSMEQLLRRMMGENIQLELVLAPDSGNIKVDPTHFEPAILNLAVNARDAMPQGGKLTIETTPLEVAEGASLGSLAPGRYVVVRVSDSGAGMSEETLRHIFEPFYTTKQQPGALGLGLSMVYGFVKESGGEILVHSQPGQGASFALYFPAANGAAETMEARSAHLYPLFGNETVLLVDPDESLRSLLRSVLQRKGYQVLEAARGDEALALAEQHDEEIHLLIADWNLSEMSGPQLVDRVRRSRPQLAALLISAYVEGEHTRKELPAGAIFLPKPFTLEALLRRLREALALRQQLSPPPAGS